MSSSAAIASCRAARGNPIHRCNFDPRCVGPTLLGSTVRTPSHHAMIAVQPSRRTTAAETPEFQQLTMKLRTQSIVPRPLTNVPQKRTCRSNPGACLVLPCAIYVVSRLRSLSVLLGMSAESFALFAHPRLIDHADPTGQSLPARYRSTDHRHHIRQQAPLHIVSSACRLQLGYRMCTRYGLAVPSDTT